MKSELQKFRRPSLSEIEQRVCRLAEKQMGKAEGKFQPRHRLLEDLYIDSLDTVELLMAIEEEFAVSLPNSSDDIVYAEVFRRRGFTLADLAEAVHLRWEGGGVFEAWQRVKGGAVALGRTQPWTQLSGMEAAAGQGVSVQYDTLDAKAGLYRRRTDGMVCVRIPEAEVELGDDEGLLDQRPGRRVKVGAFLMDRETVSVMAYARFVNSVWPEMADPEQTVREWFVPAEEDGRKAFVPLVRTGNAREPWAAVERVAKWPMIMVSWYGAAAYSLWANGVDWRKYRTECMLPTEAEWEYAARGATRRAYPWGDDARGGVAVFGQHERGARYDLATMPILPVNVRVAESPLGVWQMAGNVWQWCSDWCNADAYRQPRASQPNPIDDRDSGVKSERGGSWIGSAELCRSSYRRGRNPMARGRCLGFRCVGVVQ